ncbi:hypothetical protein B6672_008705 [Campylobacter jejuni]
MPQKSELNTPLKVIDVLLMSKYANLKHAFSSYSKEDILEIKEFAKDLRLENFSRKKHTFFKWGEFQRMLLARALLKKPKILF